MNWTQVVWYLESTEMHEGTWLSGSVSLFFCSLSLSLALKDLGTL